jgi:hypothetical protein
VGASTGGFTDCLLQRGARAVTALDVGKGQLDWKLYSDPRVRVIEGVNARYLDPRDFPEPFDLATLDLSFISSPRCFRRPPGEGRGMLLMLVKPQFELRPEDIERGGLVRRESTAWRSRASPGRRKASGFESKASFPPDSRSYRQPGVLPPRPTGGPVKGNDKLKLEKVAIVAKLHAKEASSVVRTLVKWLGERGIETFLEAALEKAARRRASPSEPFPRSLSGHRPRRRRDAPFRRPGDGREAIPILGVNLEVRAS